MPAPTITAFSGTLPSRTAGQTTAQFNTNANDLFTWLTGDFVTDVDTTASYCETQATTATTQASNASTSATNAATSETNAETYADNAASSANFKGNWSDQTGAANVPYSVFHSNRTWNLTSNLADVTLKEPGVDSEWVLAGGGSLRFLSEAVLSSDTTVDFTLPSGFSVYEFHMLSVVPSAAGLILFRTSTDGGSTFDSGASDYAYAGARQIDTGGTATDSSAGDTSMANGSIRGTLAVSGIVRIFAPSDTETTLIRWEAVTNNAGSVQTSSGGGMRDSAADVDAFRFLLTTGNFASGTIKMYGVI